MGIKISIELDESILADKGRNLDEERRECVRILSRSSEASQEYTKGKLRVVDEE
jgi:hypothetical protein